VKGQSNQKARGGAVLAKGGRGATVPKGTPARTAPVNNKNTPRGVPTARGARGVAAPVRGVAAPVRGQKGNSRGGIRNNVLTQPIRQQFSQPTRQTPKAGRGGFTAPVNTRPPFKKKTQFPVDEKAISVCFTNDQYQEFQQPQQQQPQVQQQQTYDEDDNFRNSNVRVMNQKHIDFEETDGSGNAKLRTLDSIFKSISSATGKS